MPQAAVDFAALSRRFVSAQLAGDRAEARRLVVDEGIARGARVIDVQAHVIRTAQAEIGRLWEANQISVAQEHMATAISQVVMARILELAVPTPRNGRTVAVACVEGEHHDFPARLIADYLDHAGFAVRFYGTSMPTADLARTLAASPPHALALSVTMTHNLPGLRDAVASVRSAVPSPCPIVVGGYAVEHTPTIAAELAVETAASTPEGVIDALRRVTGIA